jgi:rRNA maturation RNase YbeY
VSRMRSSFLLSIQAHVGARYAAHLRRHARLANALLPHRLHELSIALVNDATMSDLHLRFMNLPGSTDVLTFPLDEDRQAGEVIICVPEARRRARLHGTSLQNELLLYTIHGMLHLCGMDDRTPKGFTDMHRMEDEILTRLGIGPVFKTCGRKPARRRVGFSPHVRRKRTHQ